VRGRRRWETTGLSAGRAIAPDGRLEPAEPGVFELACTSGAEGKCVRFGYLPWQGEQELALYNACIHLVRADYCGDGTPHTRDGVLIELYDDLGVRSPSFGAGLEFEAVWGAQGAICVRRARVPELYSLDRLRSECPRLSADDIGEGCSEARMSQTPAAVLANRSPKRR
jgi:ADYC domain-containing protein